MPQDKPWVNVKPTSFLCGDLVFLCVVMGKKGYEKNWCYLCNLFTTKWRGDGNTPGLEWTIKDLVNRV